MPLSLPYHIANGGFGGLLPVIGVAVVAETGKSTPALLPDNVAGITFIVGSIFLKETHGHKIWEEVGERKSDCGFVKRISTQLPYRLAIG